MSEERDALVRYRIERARETLDDAKLLAERGGLRSCVNRLYYACFYSVSALLLLRGLSSTKHSGVRGLFNKEFVASGVVPKELARIYNDMFERRQESDYVDLVCFVHDDVMAWLSETEVFVDKVSELILSTTE